VGVEENRAVIRRWVEVSNAHDVDALVELFTPDTFDHVGRSAGPEWWRQVFGFLYATLPDWRWTLEEDDRVAARLTARGTHLGSEIPFPRGIAPTGKAVAWSHHHSFRLVNGKIAEQWANRDDRGFLRQVTPSDAWRSRERARVRCLYRLAGWAA
jgi:predicted ester cyclase